MKNPQWHRDEVILALDLYFASERGSVDASNPNIIKLSKILNQLPIFPERPNAETFRNANGVSLKLSNFLAIDPDYQGKGMTAYSKLDKEIFDEFVNDKQRLRQLADQIKSVAVDESLRAKLYVIEDDEISILDGVREGQVLYKLHKYRERSRKIIEKKKKTTLKQTGRLACEVCGFDFAIMYGDLGKGFIECHHTQPLATYNKEQITSIKDLALVCANCHKMLHRHIDSLTVETLRNQLASAKFL